MKTINTKTIAKYAMGILLVSNIKVNAQALSCQAIPIVNSSSTHSFSGDGGLAVNAAVEYPDLGAYDALGNFYFSDTQNNRIRKVNASNNIISTIAGNGTAAWSGDGGLATSASLLYPAHLSIDQLGNIFFIEGARIRKINATTNIITTVAGNGAYGFSGDGGLATSAQISPRDLLLDGAGNLYINSGDKIRKVSISNGIISTIAGNGTNGYSGDGGLAVNATIDAWGMAIDNTGNLFFIGGNRIRKIDAATGIINTIAGNGINGNSGDGGPAISAKIVEWGFGDIQIDNSGNIFLSDFDNTSWAATIRKINSAGIITTYLTVNFPNMVANSVNITKMILNPITSEFTATFQFVSGAPNAIYKLTPSSPTGLNKLYLEKEFNVYPIPAKDKLTINGVNIITKIDVLNNLGQLVFTQNQINATNSTVDLMNFPKGIYFVQIQTVNGIVTKKVVKE